MSVKFSALNQCWLLKGLALRISTLAASLLSLNPSPFFAGITSTLPKILPLIPGIFFMLLCKLSPFALLTTWLELVLPNVGMLYWDLNPCVLSN